MRLKKLLSMLLVLMLMLAQAAFAEETYVNLDERFGDVPTYEYEGKTYYMKDRVKTTLIMCANLDEYETEGVGSAELIILLAIDDDSKRVLPIQLDGDMIVSWVEGAPEGITLNELFAAKTDAAEGTLAMLDAMNALYPSAVINDYAVLDLEGLPLLDGVENTEENTSGDGLMERLRTIKGTVEQSSTSEMNDMLDSMSEYIVTNMKSGAMMKVVDKTDRYDRSSRVPFPVLGQEEAEAASEAEEAEATEAPVSAEPLEADLEAFTQLMLEFYYEDTKMW